MEITIITLSCNKCGAPLKVPAGTAYATCAHCGTSLQIHVGEGAYYTSVLESLGASVNRIDQDVSAIRLQGELERLEKDWEEIKAQYAKALEISQADPLALALILFAFCVSFFLICELALNGNIAAALYVFLGLTALSIPAFLVFKSGYVKQRGTQQEYNAEWRRFQTRRTEIIDCLNELSAKAQ